MFSVAIYTIRANIRKIVNYEISKKMKINGLPYEIICYDSVDNLEWDIREGKYYHLIFSEIDARKKIFLLTKEMNIKRYYSAWFYMVEKKDLLQEAYFYHPYTVIQLPINQDVFIKEIEGAIRFFSYHNNFYTYISAMKYYHIPLRIIMYVKSEKKRVEFRCHERESIYIYDKVDNIEKEVRELYTKFIRVHKSYLINIDYIYKYEPNEIEMLNGEIIPISKSRKNEIRNILMNQDFIPKMSIFLEIKSKKAKK